jgi:hypothetical protein
MATLLYQQRVTLLIWGPSIGPVIVITISWVWIVASLYFTLKPQ